MAGIDLNKYYETLIAGGTDPTEAAQIAACLPNPKKYTVKPLSRYVAVRSGWVQRQMNNLEGDADVQRLIYP